MKNLMITAAAAAFFFPLAACSKTEAVASRSTTVAVEPATSDSGATPAVAAAGEDGLAKTAYLGPTDLSAKELLGETIFGMDNPTDTTEESIAHIDDLLIGADNKVQSIVYVAGGVGGVGGAKSTIPFNAASISLETEHNDKNDPVVRVSMTDDQARAATEFDQAGLNDYRLASEIIGSKVDLASTEGDDDDAVVNDLILAKDGSVKDVIIQHSLVGSIGAGDLYAFDFGKLSVEQGDGGLFLNVTQEEMNNMNKFEYSRKAAIDEATGEVTGEVTGEAH